jgi:CHAT domain-containing protein/tetratricopeptide (TPR) repeat protein
MDRFIGSLLISLLALWGLALAQPSDDLWTIAAESHRIISAGEIEQGIEQLRALVKTCQEVYGPEHPFVSWGRAKLARGHIIAGQYEEALVEIDKALTLAEEALGTNHLVCASYLAMKGDIFRSKGRFYQAEECFQDCLVILEIKVGPEDSRTISILKDLASVKSALGRYSEAALLLERFLAHDDDLVTEAMANVFARRQESVDARIELSRAYRLMGDYSRAKALLDNKIAFEEANYKNWENGDGLADALNELALLNVATGEYETARELFLKVVDLWNESGQARELGGALTNLADLLLRVGDPELAEEVQLKAFDLWKENLPVGHPDILKGKWNLGRVDYERGLYDDAVNQYRWVVDHRTELFPDHPLLVESWDGLAKVLLELQDEKQALTASRQADQYRLKQLESMLSLTTERQRMLFQESWQPYDLLASLGSAEDLARCVLRYKGVVLDSVMEDRLYALAGQDPELSSLVEKVQQARERLLELSFQPEEPLTETQRLERMAEGPKLRAEIELWEKQLAESFTNLGQSRRSLKVEVDEVEKALPNGSVLVEFVKYKQHLGEREWESAYGAVVLSADSPPAWVPLGSAAELEETVVSYQSLVRGRTGGRAVTLEVLKTENRSTALEKLYQQLWSPIQAVIPEGTKLLVLSPDAQLNFVSFVTLLNSDGQFLGERYGILYVATGRDLLAQPLALSQQESSAVLIGNPTYSTEVIAGAALSELRGSRPELNFAPLPGTARECASLAKLTGDNTQTFTGNEATEKRLGEVKAPRVLHLATHGFFLSASAESTGTEMGNPMNRSGLALAGAQTTADLWKKGQTPKESANDGILTAQEVGGLDLRGTRLVTLSACDTGSGVAQAGEGVLGLRRGFAQAGAQNLVMTLWPVDDRQTAAFMADFYGRMNEGESVSKALLDAQRESLLDLSQKFGKAEAVRLAGPFVLNVQGPLE